MLDWNAATGTSVPFFCTRLRIKEAEGATAAIGCFRISGIDVVESISLGLRNTIILYRVANGGGRSVDLRP